MPTEHIVAAHSPRFDSLGPLTAPPQIKLCSTCHGPLADTAEPIFTLGLGSPGDFRPSPGVVCSACADRARAVAHERMFSDPHVQAGVRMRRLSTLEPMVEEPMNESDGESSSAASSTHPTVVTPPPVIADTRPSRADVLAPLSIPSRSPVRAQVSACSHSFVYDRHTESVSSHTPHSSVVAVQYRASLASPSSPPRSLGTPLLSRTDRSAFYPELDPFADVTRLRLKNTRQDCLYPGASFVGIQKSGRNSYNVSVTIVVCTLHPVHLRFIINCCLQNVDFPGSTLCGYLTIENLTDDHPQLTTYFDAEIIGK